MGLRRERGGDGKKGEVGLTTLQLLPTCLRYKMENESVINNALVAFNTVASDENGRRSEMVDEFTGACSHVMYDVRPCNLAYRSI